MATKLELEGVRVRRLSEGAVRSCTDRFERESTRRVGEFVPDGSLTDGGHGLCHARMVRARASTVTEVFGAQRRVHISEPGSSCGINYGVSICIEELT